MTTLTALTAENVVRPDLPATPGFAGLVRGELRRLTSRRTVRLLVLMLLSGIVAGMTIAFATHTRDDTAARAQAQHVYDQQLRDYDQLVATMPQADRERQGFPSREDFVGTPDRYYSDPRFHLGSQGEGLALALAGGLAVLALAIAATSIGAEWSAKTMGGLLVWEPRRGRVFAAKAIAVLAIVLAVAVAAALLLLALASLTAALRGDFGTAPPQDYGGGVVGSAPASHPLADPAWIFVRGVGLSALAALGGVGLAFLVRGTAAVLGIAFVYLALAESAVRAARPTWQAHLLTSEVLGWLQVRGLQLSIPGTKTPMPGGGFNQEMHEHIVTHGHAGLTLLVIVVAITAAGLLAFRRRDIG